MARYKNKSNIFIKMKVTEEERDQIRECAEYNNMSISDLIRVGLNAVGGLNIEYGNKKRKTKEKSI